MLRSTKTSNATNKHRIYRAKSKQFLEPKHTQMDIIRREITPEYSCSQKPRSLPDSRSSLEFHTQQPRKRKPVNVNKIEAYSMFQTKFNGSH